MSHPTRRGLLRGGLGGLGAAALTTITPPLHAVAVEPGVVDLVLTAGQSQMQGASLAPGKSAHPVTNPALCWEWNGGPCLTIVDDDVSSSGPYKPVSGSCLPSFTGTYTVISGRPIVVVRAAVGGTALLAENTGAQGDWSPTGNRFPLSVDRCRAAMRDVQAMGYTIGRVFVIWSQGYKDAQVGKALDKYGEANAALVIRWRDALGVPDLKVYIEEMYSPTAVTGANAIRRFNTVRDQQHYALTFTDGLAIAFTEGSSYSARGWLTDDKLHYNQVGLNRMGEVYAQYVAANQGLVRVEPAS